MINKQKHTNMAGMGALPLIILLGLIVVAGYFLLQGDIKIPFLKNTNTVAVRRLADYPAKITLTEEKDKMQSVIKSEDDLVKFLASADPSNKLTINEKIDFNKEWLLGVVSKTVKESGTEFRVKKVYLDKEHNQLSVTSLMRKPGDTCIAVAELSAFVDIVAINKTDKEITFETLTETYTCPNE